MPNPQFPIHLMGNGMMEQRSILTPEEKAEVQAVRAMQVRTAAADQATKLLAGKAPSMERWLKNASCIERYILGLPQIDIAPAGVGRPAVN